MTLADVSFSFRHFARRVLTIDRQELTALIAEGLSPYSHGCSYSYKGGRGYEVPGPEFATVSDIAAAVLYRGEDGKYRHIHLPLMTMSGVEPLEASA